MKRIPTFVLSTENPVEKWGIKYKILTSGMDLTTFMSNPIMLYNHECDDVIGTWDEIKIENSKLLAIPNFDEDEESIVIKNKVLKGTLKTASIGLEILETMSNEDMLIVTKSKLLEASIVAIPANEEASTIEYNADQYIFFSKNGEPIDIKKLINMEQNIDNITVSTVNETIENNDIELSKDVLVKEVIEPKINEDELAVKLELSMKIEALEFELKKEKDELNLIKLELEKERNFNIELNKVISNFNNERFETLLNSAIADSKITKESKDEFLSLSYEKAKSIIDRLPSKSVTLKSKINNDIVSEKTYEQYSASELRKLSKENPELYKQIELNYIQKLNK